MIEGDEVYAGDAAQVPSLIEGDQGDAAQVTSLIHRGWDEARALIECPIFKRRLLFTGALDRGKYR
ncbi:MAG: hypothetical protein ACJAWL_000731 [Motiliproteus sp.]|jgi:hypothetical protein